MTDIQKARDVLAKWREGTSPGPWQRWDDDSMHDECGHAVSDGLYQPEDAALIVGTAGNPALLDAIDQLLEAAFIHESRGHYSGSTPHAERFAAAIIAADERMSA